MESHRNNVRDRQQRPAGLSTVMVTVAELVELAQSEVNQTDGDEDLVAPVVSLLLMFGRARFLL